LVGEILVGIVGQAPGHAAPTADPQRDRLGLEPVEPLAERFGARARGRNVEKPLDIFLAVPRDGELLQPGLARVDKDKDIPIAAVGARRRDELGQRVVVEFFVDDDPHADVIPPHERQDHLVALRQPAFAHFDLPGLGEQGWKRFSLGGGLPPNSRARPQTKPGRAERGAQKNQPFFSREKHYLFLLHGGRGPGLARGSASAVLARG
jgi:hypothetical protein